MNEELLLQNIILHENAYFFIKENNQYLTKRLIKTTFEDASKDKQGRFLLNIQKEPYVINEREIYYSIAIFKYIKKPSFIEESIVGWEETKLAYICLIDFENHIVIAKRNISKINDFLSIFEPLDYDVMTSIFSNENTSFEKLSMDNMNISDKAIRQKSLESNNLKDNVSTFGLQGYILNNVRVNNDDSKIALSLNASRINQLGPKNNFEGFLKWSDKVVESIKDCTLKISFLSSFAKSVDYTKYKDVLNPTAILIILSKLYKEYEENKIKRCFIKLKIDNEYIERDINLLSILKHFEKLVEIEVVDGDYHLKHELIKDLFLFKNNKSITLRSAKLAKVHLEYENDLSFPILSVLNWTKSYIITFDNPELIYCNRKLFKDSRLLGNLDGLLKIFIPYSELENVSSEKGSFRITSTLFDANSVFGFVEEEFMANHDYFICDDLYKEWADHIGLSENTISFYHSKYKDSNFSASDFQDIIGQALKNLGNLSPGEDQWSLKENYWERNYKNDGILTQISRIRTGQNEEDVIEYFKKVKGYPNIKKQVFIVINFISKAALEDRLMKLQNGEYFVERNEVIQILWFVSSLISSCYEANTEVYICCKP